jgi:hypothetical protein
MQETDLFPPIKKYLENAGYSVRAEVKLTAVQPEQE